MTSLTLHSPKPGSALEATVGHQHNFLNSYDAGSCVDTREVFDLYCGDFLKHPASASLLYLLVRDLEIKGAGIQAIEKWPSAEHHHGFLEAVSNSPFVLLLSRAR